jgi:ferredoxin-NADP reductase/bacterioferritin-associated ferredoxin
MLAVDPPSDAPDGAPTACSRQGVACLCTGVTHAELDEAIAADQEATVHSLGQSLGCGVQCGSCIPAIRQALGKVAWFAATAVATPITRCNDGRGFERLIYRVYISLAEEGHYPRVLPGQHVVIRAQTDHGTVERTYTVVQQDREARSLVIAVRRNPDGKMTPWLLEPAQDGGPRHIEVSVPGGPRLGSRGKRPDVFFAGGVGITPAVAIMNALPPSGTMHIHYSVNDAEDAAFVPEFEARTRDRPLFSYSVRKTSTAGPITEGKIRRIAQEYPGAQFYVCGPQGYVELVRRGLKRARVDSARVHVELFALSDSSRPVRTFRFKAYAAGALMALLPLLLLLPALEDTRPHGHPNVGHETLKCASCHVDSTASLRQTLQAKVKHAVGLRQTGATMGKQTVTSATCIQCHANSDDRHAPNRFLEPRFDQARAEIAPQLCVSCHREHTAVRVTAPTATYCVSCHQDLKVKNDKVSPTHDYLVQNKRWETCLQCHDYHGNHKWSAPLKLQDAHSIDVLDKYLKGGPSPFGATIVKAKPEKTL